MSESQAPKSPRKGKNISIRVLFMNDTIHVFQVPVKGYGSLIWEAVVNHLQLLEADYFDLEFTDHHGDNCWLDKDKIVLKQIGSPDVPLRFCVKFYTPDPGLVEDELTRYLFALQVRKDLQNGELRCSDNTAALLASYIVQGELGDFDIEEYPDPTYLAAFKFVPEHMQTPEFMVKAMDYHKQHFGESPSEADLNLLDTARKIELFGIKMHPAKDHEGMSLNLAVAHLGILVFQRFTKINTFSWAKVRKLSFKRKKFLIKLHADTYVHYKDVVEFFFENRDKCKLFWKRCIEHHAFFRCQVVAKGPRSKTRVVSQGSSFRYCGRTQKQVIEYVRENIGKRPHFERSTSCRISCQSTSVTPKFAAKPDMQSSSADLHTSSGSHTSGSHILDSNHKPSSTAAQGSVTPHSAVRAESNIHSDSSMSGSRSLNSPRPEHDLSIDQDVIEAVNARTGGALTDDDDDDDSIRKNDGNNRERMSHVASETKGAHSLLSPELNSPVFSIGIYSELHSPVYQSQGFTSSSMDIAYSGGSGKTSVVSSDDFDSHVQVNHLLTSNQALSPPCSDSNLKKNSMDFSLLSDSIVLDNQLNSQEPRCNLDLMLTNPTSSSSVNSSLASLVESSSLLLSHQHQATSYILLGSSLLSICKHAFSNAPLTHKTTTPPVKTTTSDVSVSQNEIDHVNEILCVPQELQSSGDVSSISVTSTHIQTCVLSKFSENTQEAKKVSTTSSEQHQQETKVKDLVKPFPSPPPSLSPQTMENDLMRSLDASPSSCVTDIACRWPDQKVRFSSIVSSNSYESSPLIDVQNKSSLITTFQPMFQENECSIDQNACERTKSKLLRSASNKDETAGSMYTEVSKREVGLEKSSPSHEVIQAGVLMKDLPEAEQGVSLKLFTGTNLIKDIPYILHKRLDGHKGVTAVYKIMQADNIMRQGSMSPFSKGDAQEAPTTDETSRILDKGCFGSEITADTEHDILTLPAKTDYSSTDGTTSPSGELALLKNPEHETVPMFKLDSLKSGEAVAQQELQENSNIITPVTSSDIQGKMTEATSEINELNNSFSIAGESANNLETDTQCQTDSTSEVSKLTLHEHKETGSSGLKPTYESQSSVQKVLVSEELGQNRGTDVKHVSEAVGVTGVQFYSPKIPGAQKFVSITLSDESPEIAAFETGASVSVLSDNVSSIDFYNNGTSTSSLQCFEVMKPQPCHGHDTSYGVLNALAEDGKYVPKKQAHRASPTNQPDLLNMFGKLQPQFILSVGEKNGFYAADNQVKGSVLLDSETEGKQHHRALFLSAASKISISCTSSSSDTDQFLIDLASPAAAMFYSDNDSPLGGGGAAETLLTFSTFRPDSAEEVLKAEESTVDKMKSNRWSLHSVEEATETTAIDKAIEKRALQKKACGRKDKPKISSLDAPGLSLKCHMLSAPIIGPHLKDKIGKEMDHHLSRTVEIENIPEVVKEDSTVIKSLQHSPHKRSSRKGVTRQFSNHSYDIDSLPTPPPSPPPLTPPSPNPPPSQFGDVEPLSSAPAFSKAENGKGDRADYSSLNMKTCSGNSSEEILQKRFPAGMINNRHDVIENRPTVKTFIATAESTEVYTLGDEQSCGNPEKYHGELETVNLMYHRSDSLDTARMRNFSEMNTFVSSQADTGVKSQSEGRILATEEREDEQIRRVRQRPTDVAFFIAKELLMTERTYKKDLEVLCVWFRNALNCDPAILNSVSEVLFQYFDPIYSFHQTFLKEIEQRLAAWEGKTQLQVNGDCQKIGDIILKATNGFEEVYRNYFHHLDEILSEINTKVKKQRPFEEICRGFESQKVCYLPLSTFFLRPGQQLLHYKIILERLVKHYSFTHHDTEDCKEALCQITELINVYRDCFIKVTNLEKLMELQRDLLGLENLVQIDRNFIREGCLQKFSRKGYQQRMFFLFSDMLVYTSRASASQLQFKVHGQLSLHGLTVEEIDQNKSAIQNSFAIYAGNKYFLVAASTQEEKDKWIEDINEAVIRVKHGEAEKLQYPSLKSSASTSSSEIVSGENFDGEQSLSTEKPIQHRANVTMHVCWHRNTSVSMRDHQKAIKTQLSGYLLRKFKTSSGWQKLWVVFTNFCLFFYKTYEDDFPLASLPLLGYAVNTPDEDDAIIKEHVFKLQFKNHVYFFRAESEYTFSRWMEVINSATHNARRVRLFSRLDSHLDTS